VGSGNGPRRIATQMMVERQLSGEGTTRQELGREGFVERVWQWKGVYGGAILDQMKRLEPAWIGARVLHHGRAAERRREGGLRPPA